VVVNYFFVFFSIPHIFPLRFARFVDTKVKDRKKNKGTKRKQWWQDTLIKGNRAGNERVWAKANWGDDIQSMTGLDIGNCTPSLNVC
jgi:hypothetical protein